MRIRTLLTALLVTACVPAWALASSHSEAPGTAKDRLADDTDTYAFVSPDCPTTVTLIGNWVPLQEPAGGPNFFNFDDEAYYIVNVDNVGDAARHIWYEFKFTTTTLNTATFLYNTGPITSLTDPDFNVRQTYSVTRYDNGVPTVLGSNLPVPPNRVGPKSTPDYGMLAKAAVSTLSDGSKVFCGQRDDAFFVDLGAVFDLLTIRKLPGDQGRGVDFVSGYNVLTIALQIPKQRLTKDGKGAGSSNGIIGVWTTVERPQTRTLSADGTQQNSGPRIQVSRLGAPLVNEVVIARADKDRFNASSPAGDVQFLNYVTDPEAAKLLNLLYGISVPPAPRNDLVAVFLTGVAGLTQPAGVTPSEQLRLNMTIAPTRKPSRFGVLAGDVAGFPNGRRLADDVTDIELRAVAGVLVEGFNIEPNNRLGDGIDCNDKPFLPYFPYLALPHSGFSPRGHRIQHGPSHNRYGVEPFAERDAAELSDPSESEELISLEVEESAGEVQDETTSNDGSGSIAGLKLMGANPARDAALEYALERRGRVQLQIFDVQGRVVRTLIDQDAAAGRFSTRWDGLDEAGTSAGRGVFFARLAQDGRVIDSRKIVLN